MSVTLPAVYEHGLLRPLAPLVLPEASQVRVQIFQDERDERAASYQRALAALHRFVTAVEQSWSNLLVQQVFVQRIETDARALWGVADPAMRELCGILVLASVQVQAEHVTQAQVRAFLLCLNVLEAALQERRSVTDAELDRCYDQFLLAGLPPAITLNEKVVQSYLDEL